MEVTNERAAIYNFPSPPLLDITCRICTRVIGQTTNVLHTLDLCYACREKWIAELRREQNLLAGRRAMEMLFEAMAKEKRA